MQRHQKEATVKSKRRPTSSEINERIRKIREREERNASENHIKGTDSKEPKKEQ